MHWTLAKVKIREISKSKSYGLENVFASKKNKMANIFLIYKFFYIFKRNFSVKILVKLVNKQVKKGEYNSAINTL